ncbi:MAG: hypothetical protein ACRERD_35370 [Candidatus Binatia bacterium]
MIVKGHIWAAAAEAEALAGKGYESIELTTGEKGKMGSFTIINDHDYGRCLLRGFSGHWLTRGQ